MERETDLGKLTRAWIQADADAHYGGDWGAACAAKLEAAYIAAHAGKDLWAGLTAEQYLRARRGDEIRLR